MMDRRSFLTGIAGAAGAVSRAPSVVAATGPLVESHFPNRLYQFVWRNWELANLDRMARVVDSTPRAIERLGRSMGLPPKPTLSLDQLRRIYILLIRQNWHLLPNAQIMDLLDWDRTRFEFTLQEDDFLDQKLGPKPACRPVQYSEPTAAERRRAAAMRRTLASALGADLDAAGEPAFAFVERLSSAGLQSLSDPAARPGHGAIDVTGWTVEAGEGVDARVAGKLAEYLRVAMHSVPGGAGRGAIRLQVVAGEGEWFSVEVDSGSALLTASSASALLQAVYWLEDEMEAAGGPFIPAGRIERRAALDPRHLYSFFALYGDPLLETEVDSFPQGYLEKLGRAGINGVWIQAILATLAPSTTFPEFGRRCEERLENLDRLVRKAAAAGLKVYLYINEPRSRPAEFFRNRPELRGAEQEGFFAICTTPAVVRDWISDSLAQVFARVPELGGVFSITMSENLTNCASRLHPERCPRCSKRASWEVVGEVLEAIHSGVRRSSRSADVIAWDWGWTPEMARRIIPALAADTKLQSVSEWSIPIERGGIRAEVGEYSISVVGPGPRAQAHWELAREAGVAAMAKTQFNNTWEISAVPYIPVPNLVARHAENLLRAGVRGVQASWTLGGYPSPNLEVAKEFYFLPARDSAEALRRVALRRYGASAAPDMLEAWAGFSRAFEHYPYGVSLYHIPTQHGPANLLRAVIPAVPASMILFPQDDYKRWAGKYPPPVAAREFARMADLWQEPLAIFRRATQRVPESKRRQADEDLAIAETCYLHFRSTANQLEFYVLRDSPDGRERLARLRALAADELELARRLYRIARRHSVIGYEASNHYYYRPADLLEKIVACRHLLDGDLARESQ
jgi:hypothetical protein